MALFTKREQKELERLLTRAVDKEEAFTLEEIHGFLFGLTITPAMIPPSEWLPVAFGEEMFEFNSQEEGQELLGGIFQIYNSFNDAHKRGRLDFPFDLSVMQKEDIFRIGHWAFGLDTALSLRPEAWGMEEGQITNISEDDRDEIANCFAIIMAVAYPEEIPELFDKPDFDAKKNKDDSEFLAQMYAYLPGAVNSLQEISRELQKQLFSWPPPARRSAPEPGRNEPCPCGSGKKYKKCCGA